MVMLRHWRSAAAVPETGAQTRTVCGYAAHDARAASPVIYAPGMRTANCRPAAAASIGPGAGIGWEQSPVSTSCADRMGAADAPREKEAGQRASTRTTGKTHQMSGGDVFNVV